MNFKAQCRNRLPLRYSNSLVLNVFACLLSYHVIQLIAYSVNYTSTNHPFIKLVPHLL